MHPKLSSSSSNSSNRHLLCGEDGNGVSFAAIPPDPRPWGLGPKFRNPSYGDVSSCWQAVRASGVYQASGAPSERGFGACSA